MEIFKKYGDVWSEGFEEGMSKQRALDADFLDRECDGLHPRNVAAKTIIKTLAIRIRTGARLPKERQNG